MANHDHPVNGKHSKLPLLNSGNLILTDASNLNVEVRATNTVSLFLVQLFLYDTGNLVLRNKESVLWESFVFPTDTLVGDKNLSSQLQNATSKFSGKFQINVIKLIKLDDDMCHPNWHHIGISKFTTCRLTHRIKIKFLFKIYG